MGSLSWSKIGKAAIETLKSINRGDLIIRMGFHKLFPFALFLFCLGCLNIWMHYQSEQTMLKVEKNKETIQKLEIDYSKKTYDIVELGRISTIEDMLREKGSDVRTPDKPADILR